MHEKGFTLAWGSFHPFWKGVNALQWRWKSPFEISSDVTNINSHGGWVDNGRTNHMAVTPKTRAHIKQRLGFLSRVQSVVRKSSQGLQTQCVILNQTTNFHQRQKHFDKSWWKFVAWFNMNTLCLKSLWTFSVLKHATIFPKPKCCKHPKTIIK